MTAKDDQTKVLLINGWTVHIDKKGVCEIRDDKGMLKHKSRDHITTAAHLATNLITLHYLEKQQDENARLQKILSHVPAKIAIKAKEDAGYGTEIRTMKEVDDRMEAQHVRPRKYPAPQALVSSRRGGKYHRKVP
jgi:hypothetical protein